MRSGDLRTVRKPFLYLAGVALVAFAGLVVSACGDDDAKPPDPSGISGSFSGTAGACDRGVTSVRAIDDAGGRHDAALREDCSFVVQVPREKYVYLQALDAQGNPVAVVSWEDPTKFNDGRKVHLTSFVRLGEGYVDLGRLGFVEQADAQKLAIGTVELVGAASPILLSGWSPSEISSTGDGIPDSSRAGFLVGADSAGNKTPVGVAANPSCSIPKSGQLHGQIKTMLYRRIGDGLPQASYDEMAANPDKLGAGTTLVPDGFTRGPIVQRGVWVVFGNKKNPEHVVMADGEGTFAIDAAKIPEGIAVAKVYFDLSAARPLFFVPLCMLKGDRAEAQADGALLQWRAFPDACSMNSTRGGEGSCHSEPDAAEVSDMERDLARETGMEGSHVAALGGHGGHGGMKLLTHSRCGADNTMPCCLDYDGTSLVFGAPFPGRPHEYGEYLRSYRGSTCERYVDEGCCANEGGTLAERIGGMRGTRNLVPCWRNHHARNCQNVDLDAKGLVLSASKATRDAADPSTNPETITVARGSKTTLYLRNNTCQNTDAIVLAGCGAVTPSGVGIPHPVRNRTNFVDRDVVFDAPDIDCDTQVLTFAYGQVRSVFIRVRGPGAPPPPPPQDSGVALGETEVSPVKASFNQQAQSTTYSVAIKNPAKHDLTIQWTGPDCGDFNPKEVLGPSNADPLEYFMNWFHPHPLCPTTDHSAASIRATIAGPGYTIVCTYQGAETGTGPACTKQ